MAVRVPVIRASRKSIQTQVVLDYLENSEVTLSVSLGRGDPEVIAALAPLETLLVARARAAVAQLRD